MSGRFQPGEGPSSDLLRDCEIFANLQLKLCIISYLAGFSGEADSAHGLVVGVLHPDVEGEAVLPEGMELVEQLVPGLGHGEQVAAELEVVGLALQHLHVPRLGDLVEVLLVLQRLVLLVVCHAEHPHPCLQQLMPLGEHAEPAHTKRLAWFLNSVLNVKALV